MRAAADPGLHLVRLRSVARGDARRGWRARGVAAQVFLTSLAFVLGFSIVFVALGASATAVGKFLFARLPLLSKIAGVLLIIFGLHTMGVFRLAFLETEKRVQAQRKPAGPLGAMLVGIAFAFGWTPCIGPILGGILAMAGSKNSIGEGRRRCWPSTRWASACRS